MNVRLIPVAGDQCHQPIPVNVPEFLMGRAKNCNFRSYSLNVSRKHCIIHTGSDAVTIQDLGGENGTFVNGRKIISPQKLHDKDEIVIGKHKFIVSLTAEDQQEDQQYVPKSELLFEVRYKGQSVIVSRNKLFDLAAQGYVKPDDLITITGTKVFADTIEGIVFGEEPSAASPPTVTSIEPAMVHDVLKTEENVNPFDNADSETKIQVPPLQQHSFLEVVSATSEVQTETNQDMMTRSKQILACILGIVCLVGVLWFYFSVDNRPEGIFYLEGMLTLDGNPVQDVSVTLHPRKESGFIAGGLTDASGKFTVTTGTAPVGSGAREGEYDVTFYKVEMEGMDLSMEEFNEKFGNQQPEVKHLIPQKYSDVKSSGLVPIKVESTGKNRFNFDLITSRITDTVNSVITSQDEQE